MPMAVETTGRPTAMDSNALMRVPPPTRRGMTEMSAAER